MGIDPNQQIAACDASHGITRVTAGALLGADGTGSSPLAGLCAFRQRVAAKDGVMKPYADGGTLRPTRDALQVRNFLTHINGQPRTFGCVIDRPAHRTWDLQGLDLTWLTRLATGRADTAAWGKLAIAGLDGAGVLQTASGATPVPVWCGHATSSLALLTGSGSGFMRLHGPEGRSIGVSFAVAGSTVSQRWIVPSPVWYEQRWRGRIVLRCDALNRYALLIGPLPEGVTPEAARLELVGCELGAKLAVITKLATEDVPRIHFCNASGVHGALPMTGAATISILTRLSKPLAECIPLKVIRYQTKNGWLATPLPNVRTMGDGSVVISMPSVSVQMFPLSHMEVANV